MNRQEIQAELALCTLRLQDASEEARALLTTDADLKAWFQAECLIDESLHRCLDDSEPVSVPEGFHSRLVEAWAASSDSSASQPPQTAAFHSLRTVGNWLAAAAAIALGLFIVKPWELGEPAHESRWQADAIALLDRIESGSTPLDQFSSDLAVLKTSLGESGTPLPVESALPKRFPDIPLLGCKSCVVDGHSASVICFRLGENNEAHIVVLDQPQPDVDGTSDSPSMTVVGDWNVARWVQDGKTYLLATRGPAEELQKLFATLLRERRSMGWV